MESRELQQSVIEKLKTVIDPETGADVVQMQLVKDIHVDPQGDITYVFRPSSPLCPLAVPLALSIIEAINAVPGITRQHITVVDYVGADQLNEMLRSVLEEDYGASILGDH